MNPVKYLVEVKKELGQVTWPSFMTVVKLTGVVILTSLIVGAYTGALDYGFANLLKIVVNK